MLTKGSTSGFSANSKSGGRGKGVMSLISMMLKKSMEPLPNSLNMVITSAEGYSLKSTETLKETGSRLPHRFSKIFMYLWNGKNSVHSAD